MSNVTIQEEVKVTSKESFKIKVDNKVINLLGTTSEFKTKLLQDLQNFRKKKVEDFNWLTKTKIPQNQESGIDNKESYLKASSMNKRIIILEKEIDLVITSFIVDNQSLENHIFIPIGENTQFEIKSHNDIMEEIMETNYELYEQKVVDYLIGGHTEYILDTLKKIALHHNYRLTKIAKK